MSESQILSNDRVEWKSARDAQDTGGLRWVAGRRFYIEDLPTEDEL